MSLRQKKGKKESAPMPSTGAGLMRYFDEDLPGIKIGPKSVVLINSIFILIVIIANSKLNPFNV
ncbi:MAG: preprotein translocase subunit Sec61beta [Candidatus Heimdallarchaeota archaeon]|nr:preprotein translocase subunit Sec61beta [Candidatus Heimdallarchaeota archaeon]